MSPIIRDSIPQIIINKITEGLINGELKPGDKILTENEFCATLGVGRNSVREAIKVLVAYGVLEIKRSEGTFVTREYKQQMLDPMIYGLILAQDSLSNLIEFKLTFLNALLFMAMEKATDEDIKNLKRYCADFLASAKENPADINKMYNISHSFNEYLGDISRNPMLQQLNQTVLKISRFTRTKAITVSVNRGIPECLPNLYIRKVELIEKRDCAGLSSFLKYTADIWKSLLF